MNRKQKIELLKSIARGNKSIAALDDENKIDVFTPNDDGIYNSSLTRKHYQESELKQHLKNCKIDGIRVINVETNLIQARNII